MLVELLGSCGNGFPNLASAALAWASALAEARPLAATFARWVAICALATFPAADSAAAAPRSTRVLTPRPIAGSGPRLTSWALRALEFAAFIRAVSAPLALRFPFVPTVGSALPVFLYPDP